MLSQLLTYPLKFLLRFKPIRERLAFGFVHHHFDDLNVMVPLSNNLACPIPHLESLQSFSEIYIANDYGDFLKHMPLPKRWLDLGCHMGYFSLYLIWQHALKSGDWVGTTNAEGALLIDADPRVFKQLNRVIDRNLLQGKFQTLNAAIAPSDQTSITFALRSGMVSSIDKSGDPIIKEVTVPRLSSESILSRLKPPYDLIKMDVEGAEFRFLEDFPEILKDTQALLLEWHGWGSDTDAEERIQALTAKLGFKPPIVLKERECYHSTAGELYAGNHLYLR